MVRRAGACWAHTVNNTSNNVFINQETLGEMFAMNYWHTTSTATIQGRLLYDVLCMYLINKKTPRANHETHARWPTLTLVKVSCISKYHTWRVLSLDFNFTIFTDDKSAQHHHSNSVNRVIDQWHHLVRKTIHKTAISQYSNIRHFTLVLVNWKSEFTFFLNLKPLGS